MWSRKGKKPDACKSLMGAFGIDRNIIPDELHTEYSRMQQFSRLPLQSWSEKKHGTASYVCMRPYTNLTRCTCANKRIHRHTCLHFSFFGTRNQTQERERTVRDLRASLKEAAERLSKYDGLPESQQIRQRMLDLEVGTRQGAGQSGGAGSTVTTCGRCVFSFESPHF